MSRCARCQLTRPAGDFYTDPRTGGPTKVCRECTEAAARLLTRFATAGLPVALPWTWPGRTA